MFSWNYSAFIFFSVFFFLWATLSGVFLAFSIVYVKTKKKEKRRNNKDRVSAVLRWFRTIVYTFEMTCVSPHILNIADIQIQIKYITRACISYVSSHLSWFQLSLYMSGVCMYVCMCASFAFVFFLLTISNINVEIVHVLLYLYWFFTFACLRKVVCSAEES